MASTAPDGVPPKTMISLFLRMYGWISLIFLLAFLILTFISSFMQNRAWEFDADGQMASAKITNKYTTTSTDSDGNRKTSFWLELSYNVNGVEQQNKDGVSSSLYHQVRHGERIDIRYLPRDPMIIETTIGENQSGAVVTQWIALVFGVLTLGAFWMPARWTVSALIARRRGRLLKARVTEIFRTNVKVNKQPRYRLVWQDEEGGTGRSLMAASFDDYPVGTEIEVYTSPRGTWWREDIGDAPAGKRENATVRR